MAEFRRARRASGTRTFTDILLLRFLRRSPQRDIRDLERLQHGDRRVRPISVSCFLSGHEGSADGSEFGHVILDGARDRFVSRRGAVVPLAELHVRLTGVSDRPGQGVVKKPLFTEMRALSDYGELRISVPTVDVLLVQTALAAPNRSARSDP
jgi:hypothetical protein